MSQFPNQQYGQSVAPAQNGPGFAPGAPYQGAPTHPVGFPQGAPPAGGGSIFAGKPLQSRSMGGKVFMCCGTYWVKVAASYRNVHSQTRKRSNFLDLTVLRVLDPALGVHQPHKAERPHRVGEDVNYCISEGGVYATRDFNRLVFVAMGMDLDAQPPEAWIKAEADVYDKGMLTSHVFEVRSRKHKPKQGDLINIQDFVRRVPWQEVQMVLDANEQQRFFKGQLAQLAQSESQAPPQGLGTIPGWQPGIVGPGAAKEPAALAAINFQMPSMGAPAAPTSGYGAPMQPAQPQGYANVASGVQNVAPAAAPYQPPAGQPAPQWNPNQPR